MTNLIVTITDYSNYGNRLQNYALQTLLSQYEETTTAYMDLGISNSIDYITKKLRSFARPLRKVFTNKKQYLSTQRAVNFRNFSNSYINDKDFELTQHRGLISKTGKQYDRVIIGSDQVWNPQWITNEELALRLGSFVPHSHSVISYAASFGTSTIRESSVPVFQNYLPDLKSISVREFQGVDLVREMTGLDSTVVLDPTLMIDAEDWQKITSDFVSKDDHYVLTYFLGSPTDEQEQSIREYANSHNCRIRRILDYRDQETYLAAPQDFVELFSKASYVFTDSYHACCFSILFQKQFTVFNRIGTNNEGAMNSRMETLFDILNLHSPILDSGLAPEIDYTRVNESLIKERISSKQWLDTAILL